MSHKRSAYLFNYFCHLCEFLSLGSKDKSVRWVEANKGILQNRYSKMASLIGFSKANQYNSQLREGAVTSLQYCFCSAEFGGQITHIQNAGMLFSKS